MSSEYSPLRRFSRWLTRWRHRCGYGVHSPWAFSWITEVIYNDFAYYAYAPLHRRRLLPAADPESLAGALNEKDDRLLFRLVNAAEAREIALVGAVGPREKAYLAAARTGARFTTYATLPLPVENSLAQHDFLYFSSADLLPMPPYSPIPAESRPEGCRLAVVHGIDRGPTARAAWVSFRNHPDVHVSFDLGRFGLAFFAPQLQRQHYVVAYF